MGLRACLGLLGWLIMCFGVAFVGALASINAREFYGLLQQPPWAPPGSVFGPVWSVLYALMAIAVWRVWLKVKRLGHMAVSLFVVQLLANGLWSWLFFTWQLGALALLELVLLWLLIAATAWRFWLVDRAAACLMMPYLAWVTFAGVLNYTLWQLNSGLLSG